MGRSHGLSWQVERFAHAYMERKGGILLQNTEGIRELSVSLADG